MISVHQTKTNGSKQCKRVTDVGRFRLINTFSYFELCQGNNVNFKETGLDFFVSQSCITHGYCVQ